MEGTMKTAVMTGISQVEIMQRPIPVPADNEVLVKVEYVGICGSDLHYYESGRIGNFIVEPPFVLGHEAGGTVVEVGAGVTNLKAGDRVALEPGKTCGHCEHCKGGKYNLCEDVIFFATPPVDGVFQEYVAHEAGLCFKLPDNMSTMEIVLNMLAEATTTELSKAHQPEGFSESQKIAHRGGSYAGQVRQDIEKDTGRPVITSQNAAQLNAVVVDMIESVAETEKPDNDENK